MHARLLLPAVTLWCVRMPAAEAGEKSPPAPETSPPILAQAPAAKAVPARRPRLAPGSASSRRALSPEMAKKISESVERTFPTAKFDATKAATDHSGTAGASDATQLEPFIVQEDKTPKLKERDLRTMLEELARTYRLHPGLRGLGNQGVAREMSEADKEQERRRELAELSSVLQAGGAKAPPGVQRKIDEAMTRDNGWLNSPPGTRFRELK